MHNLYTQMFYFKCYCRLS